MPLQSNPDPLELDEVTRDFYLRAMGLLDDAEVPYMVGGAYSLAHHAGIVRHTKDLDLFVRRDDRFRALEVLEKQGGYRTEMVFPHWLGKAFDNDAFVDIIFGSGNGLCPVDDEWFDHALEGTALGRTAKLCPAEEIIWSKAFIQERERFDGADIAHVIQARGHSLDWSRLCRRFQGHERVLLAHLLMFGYIYPAEREQVPSWVMTSLYDAVRAERPAKNSRLCRGPYLSRQQYLPDLRKRGYHDARLRPAGNMDPEEIAHWTAAIGTIR
ncbi:MAG TPA: hypothetical protein VLJ39_22825 [Tepidisphaeraceae bacterium]|nr:hypothetical protein [Tepidisphaeraceae bacterium]